MWHCRQLHTRNTEGASWHNSTKLIFPAMPPSSNLKHRWATMSMSYMILAAYLSPGKRCWSFRPRFHQLLKSEKEPQSSYLADALYQENEKPVPGGVTDNETIPWTRPEYAERRGKVGSLLWEKSCPSSLFVLIAKLCIKQCVKWVLYKQIFITALSSLNQPNSTHTSCRATPMGGRVPEVRPLCACVGVFICVFSIHSTNICYILVL